MSKITSDELERDFAAYVSKKNGLSMEEALARVKDGTYPRAPKKKKNGGTSA